MKIGVDVQSVSKKKTGIGYYTDSIVRLMEKDGSLEIKKFRDHRDELNTIERMRWENVALPGKIKNSGIDVLHVPGFAGPYLTGTIKKITTVHDLIGMIYPDNLGKISRLYWKRWLPFSVKSSDFIIADSINTKKDIIRLLRYPEERIEVIYLASDESYIPIKDKLVLSAVKEKYSLPDEFMLNVGTIEPRKNIPVLIEAFASYINSSASDIKLVLTGKKDWGYDETLRIAGKFNILSKIIFTDYVDDEDMPGVYNLAKFFVYPSYYEGFGLPVLESLSCGIPVICSNVSSVPEVAGDAGKYVDPLDVPALAKAISEFDNNEDMRKYYSEKAVIHASEFSWDITAKKTLEIYKKVVNE